VEEKAGLSEGYYAKILHGERLASFDTLNRIVVAMMWGDVKVKLHTVSPRQAMRGAEATERILKINESVRTYQRGRMLELAPYGGFARAESLSPERRKAIAQHAARVRWGRPDSHNPQPGDFPD